jgi:hypothetical protein
MLVLVLVMVVVVVAGESGSRVMEMRGRLLVCWGENVGFSLSVLLACFLVYVSMRGDWERDGREGREWRTGVGEWLTFLLGETGGVGAGFGVALGGVADV